MAAMIMPMMLAIVNLILRPKVRIRIPRFNVTGLSNPNVFPYDNQDRAETPLVNCAIKLPKTIPASKSRKRDHVFLPVRAICNSSINV